MRPPLPVLEEKTRQQGLGTKMENRGWTKKERNVPWMKGLGHGRNRILPPKEKLVREARERRKQEV